MLGSENARYGNVGSKGIDYSIRRYVFTGPGTEIVPLGNPNVRRVPFYGD